MNNSLMFLSKIGRILVDFLLLDHEDTEITYQEANRMVRLASMFVLRGPEGLR